MFKFQPHGWLRGRRGNAPALTWLPLLLFFLIPRPLFAGADDDSSSRPVGAGREVGEEANEPTNFEAVLQICVTAGFHQVKLSWNPPTTTPTTYHVQYRTTSSGPWENVQVLITNSPYTVIIPHSAAAADPETFGFRIRSYFATTTTFSDFVTIDSIERAPPSGEPTNLMVGPRSGADEDDQSASLNWDLITDPAARYLVESKESNDPDTEWFSHDDDTLSAGTSAVVVYDLKKGDNTDFRVKGLGPCAAISAFAADTSYSNVVTSSDGGPSITKPETPDRPATISYYDRDDRAVLDSVVLTWVLPENGGADIDRQEIERLVFPIGGGSSTADTFPITSAGTLRYKDSEGLMPGNDYYYLVRVHNSEGWSDFSDRSVKVTYPVALVPLDPPTGLAAEALTGTDDIRLTWTTPSPVPDKYEIQKRSDDNDAWTLLSFDVDGALEVYTHAGVGPGETFFYRIRAKNDDGAESPWHPAASDPSVSATTEGGSLKPSAPSNLRATASDDSTITLRWDAPSDSGGSAITGYRIEVSDDGGDTWDDLVEDTESTTRRYSHTGLSDGDERHYRVSAINGEGTGPVSNIVDATVGEEDSNGDGEPGRPQDLEAEATDTATIRLSWDEPDDAGASDITGYRIEYSLDEGDTWEDLEEDTETTITRYRHGRLDPGTTVYYRVSAINDAGTGEPSEEVDATTDGSVPRAPQNLTATLEDSTVALTWDVPTSNGGAVITGYQVEAQVNDGSWSVIATTAASQRSYSQTIGPATTVKYRVSAINANGVGVASDIVTAERSAAVPDPPSPVSATADSSTAIVLNWGTPENDGGSEITGYRIEAAENGSFPWTILTENAGVVNTYTHTGLSAGEEWYYRIYTLNAAGQSTASVLVSTRTAYEAPSVPLALQATTAGSDKIILRWTAPVSTGGSPIAGYRIEVSDDGSAWVVLVDNTASKAVGYTHEGVDPGTTQHYRVSAINEAGLVSVPSGAVQAATNPVAPNTPTGLVATEDGPYQIDLTWTAPEYDGGSEITGYIVEGSEDNAQWVTVAEVTETTYSHTGLSPHMTWYYRVSAKNAGGRSPASDVAFATTETDLPDPPSYLVADADSSTAIVLTWGEPHNDGGSKIIGYRIEAARDGAAPWTLLTENTGDVTTYTHADLGPGEEWHYRVYAVNEVGYSETFISANATTELEPPGEPLNLDAAAIGSTRIYLSWDPPESTGGSPIVGYRVEVSDDGVSWRTLIEHTYSFLTQANHRDLEPGTTRYYRVSAINQAGLVSLPSDVDHATTDPVPPDSPTNLIAEEDGTSTIDLRWYAPEYTGGADLTGYVIEASRSNEQWFKLASVTSTEYVHTGLSPATTWEYRVYAVNVAGQSPASETASATTRADVPDEPENLMAMANGTAEIDLTWDLPDSDGGAAVEGYQVEVSTDEGLTWVQLVAHTRTILTRHTHGDLMAATTRHYRVSAINRVGFSEPSNIAYATTDATLPDQPTNLVADAVDHSQIDLSWTAPEYDGGAEVTNYRLEVSEDRRTWSELTMIPDLMFSHTDLMPATTRYYRVIAINRVGFSEPSNVATATTDAIAPDPPTNLEAEAVGPDQIDLSWDAPEYDGGSAVTGYQVEMSEDGEAWEVLEDHTHETETVFAHTDLTPGSEYHYRVSAINDVGLSDPSNTASAYTDDPVGRATRVTQTILPYFTAAVTSGIVSAVSDRVNTVAGGHSRNEYQISRNGGSFTREGVIETWGAVEAHNMSSGNQNSGLVSWDGDIVTAHLGADYKSQSSLFGLTASRATGTYDFTERYKDRAVGGTYEAGLTSVTPYVAWLAQSGATLWAAGSFGWGDVTISDGLAGSRTTGINSRAGALGGSHILFANESGSLIRAKAEGWTSSTTVSGAADNSIDLMSLSGSRLKLLLNWTQYFSSHGHRITFLVEGGSRFDTGDGPAGLGLEVGGGMQYSSPSRSVLIEGMGRILLSDNEYRERGFRGMVQIGRARNGLAITLEPSWGATASGTERLMQNGVADLTRPPETARLNADVQYGGTLALGGTPYGRLLITENKPLLSTGLRYSLASDFKLNLEALKRKGYGLSLRGNWRF